MSTLHRIAIALVIIGAINWGLIGFFRFDLVATLFGGQQSLMARIIYALVGISGLFALPLLFMRMDRENVDHTIPQRNFHYGTEFGEEFDLQNRKRKDAEKKK